MNRTMPASLVVDAANAHPETALRGMQTAAQMADPLNVPIAWAVDAKTARSPAGAWLREREGDRFILALNANAWIRPDDGAEARARQREQLPQNIERERKAVQKALPNARLNVAGADMKNAPLAAALESLGFDALWGYRWNEASSRAADRGCPFSYFYINQERHQSGGPPAGSLIGIPRETVSLPFRRRIPPEPNENPKNDADSDSNGASDTARTAPIEAERLLAAAETAARCKNLNAWSSVCQTLSAEACARYAEPQRNALAEAWSAVMQLGFQPTALNDAAAEYRRRFPETEPTVLVGRAEQQNNSNGKTELFYADARAMFIFDEGAAQPTEFYNYVNPSVSSPYLAETPPPELTRFQPRRARDKLHIQFALDSHKPMPYALFLWGDYSGLRVVQENLLEARRIGKYGMLLLIDIETGENEFSLQTAI